MSSPREPKIVEAQQFVVRDENGKIRASLGVVNSQGTPFLTMNDENGVPRVDIEVQAGGYPSFSFSQQDGNPYFVVRRTNSGTTILTLSRGDATPGLIVIVPDAGDVKVGLAKSDGEEVWLQGHMELGDFGT